MPQPDGLAAFAALLYRLPMTVLARPKVSVVCAWYNRAVYISDTLDSLLAQDFGDFDIVLVNDGSPDPRVREVLDGYADPRLRVIHQANTGFVGAIRRAIAQSQGEYIAVMGAGDVSLPARLRLQAEALDEDPSLVGLGSSYRNVTVDETGGFLDAEDFVRKPIPITRDYILRSHKSPFTHGEVMYRRSVYEAVGGYRPTFRFTQDLDLWLRMSRHGPFTLRPELLYERRLFLSDGIQSDLSKYVVQINFANLALECARLYDRKGYDLVDVFGLNAGMMMAPDSFMAGVLSKTALKYLRNGMPEEAGFFLDLARRGRGSPLVYAACAVSALYARPRLRALAERILERLPIGDTRQTPPIQALRGRKL